MQKVVIIASIVSTQLALTLGTQILIIRLSGLGRLSDAYFAAQASALVISAIIISLLQAIWIHRLSNASENLATRLISLATAQGQAFLIAATTLGVIILSSNLWMEAVFPGFDDEQITSLRTFSLIFFFASLFNILSSILITGLRSQDRFFTPELIALGGSLFSLVAILTFAGSFNLEFAAVVFLGKSIIQYLTLLYANNWPRISLKDGALHARNWATLGKMSWGPSIQKTSPLIDRYFASMAGAGGLTMLNFSQTAMGAVSLVLERALCTPLIPGLSRSAYNGEYRNLYKTLRTCISYILIISIALVAALIILRPSAITALGVLFMLDDSASAVLWSTTMLLFGYVFSAAAGAVVVATFHAIGDFYTPLLVGLLGFAVGIPIKMYLFNFFGISGLAAGISAYYLMNMLLMSIILERKIRSRFS